VRETEPGATQTTPELSLRSGTAPTSLTASQQSQFEAFVRKHAKPLMRYLMYAAAADVYEAEEALWTVLGDVYRRWPAIDTPLAYVKRSAVRKIAVGRRRESARRHAENRATRHHESSMDGTSIWENQEWVRSLLRSLPRKQAEVLALVHDDLTTQEIGQLLGTNEATIRKRLSYARQSIRSTFSQQTRERTSPRRESEFRGEEER
jgi:RNA polymerase sigma factor (sigma-70 family)